MQHFVFEHRDLNQMAIKRGVLNGLLMLTSMGMATTVYATPDLAQVLRSCQDEFSRDATRRLVCFDKVAMQYAGDSPVPLLLAPKQAQLIEAVSEETGYLARKWHLNREEELHFTDLETHQLNYIVTSYASNPNDVPTSPSRPNTQERALDHNDVHFQLSLKTQLKNFSQMLPQNQWVSSMRLWAAYTQQSYWQLYNEDQSRPMREHNYTPELILSLGLNASGKTQAWAMMPAMLNLGLVHESNGRATPISRSWNRMYLQAGWQLDPHYSVLVRPWWRIPESRKEDDNPDMSRYLGYGDVSVRWDNAARTTAASVVMRNNLRSDNKGYIKLDLQYKPFERESLRLYAMLASGYGVSLLDYNQAQTMLGIGFTIGD